MPCVLLSQGVLAVLWYRYSLSNIFSRHHRVFIYGQVGRQHKPRVRSLDC